MSVVGLVTVAALLSWPRAEVRAQGATAAVRADYLALIERYESGQLEDAAAELAEHDGPWVASALAAVDREVRDWPSPRVGSAVMLHTDTAVDGWAHPGRIPLHLEAARRLVDAAASRHLLPDDFVRDWLLVVTWHLHSELDLAAMPLWLDRLLARWRSDRDVQVAVGAYFESLGSSDGVPPDMPWQSLVLRSVRERSQRGALDRAAEAFRRALDVAPGDDEARVRLGRTLVALRKPADAMPLLISVRDGTGDVEWRYLAQLTSATAELDRGRVDASADAYERASALLPGCQTPLVGLAAIRRLQGRAREAAEVAERLATRVVRCDDPWWSYSFGQTPERRARLLLDLRRRAATP